MKNLAEIRKSFHQAEISIKTCENSTGELPAGAINELRYSCKHLIEFLENEDQEHLAKFFRHCKRANYDSKELIIIFLKQKISDILNQFIKNEDIAQDVLKEKYFEILNSKRKTDNFLTEATESLDSREVYLEKIQEVIPILEQNLEVLQDSLPTIQRKIRRTFFYDNLKIIGATIAIIGIVLSIFSLF